MLSSKSDNCVFWKCMQLFSSTTLSFLFFFTAVSSSVCCGKLHFTTDLNKYFCFKHNFLESEGLLLSFQVLIMCWTILKATLTIPLLITWWQHTTRTLMCQRLTVSYSASTGEKVVLQDMLDCLQLFCAHSRSVYGQTWYNCVEWLYPSLAFLKQHDLEETTVSSPLPEGDSSEEREAVYRSLK